MHLQSFSRTVAAIALTLTLVITPDAALADPSGTPTPSPILSPTTLKDAKQRVRDLEDQAAEVEENYDQAKINVKASKRRVKLLNQDIATQKAKVDELGNQTRAIALLQFQNRNLDKTVQIFAAPNPESFLGQLSTASKVDENMNLTLQQHLAEQANLASMERTLNAEVKSLTAEENRLELLDKEISAKLEAAKDIVDEMSEAELEALRVLDYGGDGGDASGSTGSFDLGDLDEADINKRIKKVLSYAVSHVKGAQYVRGAAGPNAFDCSGFTLAAYRAAGVSLPHSSRSQFSVGKAVDRSDLQPGDLIFWYSPIHHVGLYLGKGMIAHARNPRADLVIQSLASYPAPYTGARRVFG